jgi:hypothetical protein
LSSNEQGGFLTGERLGWIKDVDAGLAQAKQQNKPVLLDFSAAPM